MHSFQTKELPAFPDDNSLRRQSVSRHRLGAPHEEEDVPIVETATMTRIIREEDQDMQYHQPPAVSHRWQPEGVPRLISPPDALPPTQQSEPGFLQSSFSKSPIRSRFPNGAMQTPPESSYGSSHLAPIATQPSPYSHGEDEDFNGPIRSDFSISPDSRPAPRRGLEHHREDSQNSWLDPIDESGGSTASSVHSRTSSLGYRRRHIRAGSGDTEHEFDNALDAAIEAAYDDGFEPMEADDFDRGHPDEEIVANALRRVEMAREMVRQTEREAYEVANERERNQLQLQRHHQQQLQQQQAQQTHQQQQVTVPPTGSRRAEDFFDDNSSEDEAEQMLEEMRNYTIQDYSQHGSGQQQKHQNPPRQGSVPRESDSSGLTRSTWNSSTGSNAFTSTTTLSTVTESAPIPTMPQGPAPAPPPTSALPDLPPPRPSSAQKTVRTRRLSSQNPKQLKIETQRINPPTTNKSAEDSAHPKSTVNGREPQSSVEPPKSTIATSRRPASPLAEAVSPTDLRPLGSPFGHRSTPDVDESVGRSASPSVTKLKKNFSSSSLKSLKGRAMSVSNMDDGDMSPGTPSSAHFSSARPPAVPAIPTPLAATLRERADTATGGMYLLDADFQSPVSATSHNYAFSDAPVSLEPCPTDSMLRPFWLMRCLYQTLAHPRGGYVSTKLFVPRDAWRVKGVKLKNIDEKIFNCDFLTAAISKLAKVDTCDADAMLEEMQSLEGNLEQVQAALSRKLGNEVGVQGAGVLFKDAATPVDGDSSVPRSTSVSNKSSFSWRRLRSKNSAAALGAPATARAGAEASKDTLSTLPMTAQPTSRPPKRDIANTHFEGPNSNYMASLARLFDAAQVIGKWHFDADDSRVEKANEARLADQIARQVDDPGLRHADKTQVGLELCTRHAAEFFAFYICRFVLSDLGLLMDKFIKRGTEWVLT